MSKKPETQTLTFYVEGKGDPSVGISDPSETVTVSFEYGGHDEDAIKYITEELREKLRSVFSDVFDSKVSVCTKEEYEKACAAEQAADEENDRLEKELESLEPILEREEVRCKHDSFPEDCTLCRE